MLRALVVGDNPETRRLTAWSLKRLNCTVVELPNTVLAMQILKADNPFKIVFTELLMSGIGGIQFLEQIKALYPALPVIMMASDSHPDLEREAAKKGASCILRHGESNFHAVLNAALKQQISM
jgi:CheY-like chemotaxis protein